MSIPDIKSTFNRDCAEEINLCEEKNGLIKVLMDDVKRGQLFVAFRPAKKITFYYAGRNMCDLEPDICYEPTIEAKYLPILKSDAHSAGRITEKEWKEKTGVSLYDWKDIYPEIKDNLKRLSDPEAMQVAYLYKFSPLASYERNQVVLLDIEAKFSYPNVGGESFNDLRIDVVLYNTATRQMAFVEVKRLADERLQKNGELQKEILEQLNAYKTLIKKEKNEIIREYNKLIKTYSTIYGLDIEQINEEKDILLGLLITEYSASDKEVINSLSDKIMNLAGISVLSVGNVGNVKSETLDQKWFPAMTKFDYNT